MSNLTLKGPGKDGVEIHRARLKELEDQIDQFEAQISGRSFEFRAQFEPITIEAVQAALPKAAVLVEFLVHHPYDLKLKQNGSPHYIAYILTPTGDPKWVDLGDAAAIDELVMKFRSALSDRSQKGIAGFVPLSQKLYQIIFNPVVKLAGQPQRCFLSPDGMLNLLPFAALMDHRQKYVVEQFKLTYLTSGRDLLHLKIKAPSQTPPLLVVDPDYAEGPGPQLLGVTYPPLVRLPGTAREGKQVQQYFENTQLKSGAEATEQALKAADRPLLLHIATHGSFLSDVAPPPVEPESQRNLTPVGSGLDMDQVRNTHSLLRSYLFFAGANTRSSSDNDGTLTALEAANLNLWGTKLVVLSACNTGVGEVKTGEGVYGLRRALVLAGSESQMMSLWPVSDQGTQVLMTEFYRRLKASEGRSDALQNTQLWMLNHPRWKHPFYWASFIQSGEWKPISE
ncbi:MAG TPA: CHAT domain-containing protein [Acidobacteriota bacterium]|nr:CHAT domain-containing protein [Acidobacteriota bacterium]